MGSDVLGAKCQCFGLETGNGTPEVRGRRRSLKSKYGDENEIEIWDEMSQVAPKVEKIISGPWVKLLTLTHFHIRFPARFSPRMLLTSGPFRSKLVR